ncbi:probable WRKY transcription factor 23, partial [Morus notabilis]|uniref:probable WRKY transcription factor 23 n=1 Tax=Morus notabilis TaxID=981085 RepID=UPI000CED0F11
IYICRSYYRCTSASCNVKKRVERSYSDPNVVVTTYEGQHTHPSPLTSRQLTHGGAPPAAAGPTFAMPFSRMSPLPSHYQFLQHQHHQQLQQQFADHHALSSSLPSNNNFGCDSISNAANFLHERRFCTPTGPANLLITDHGLLQDIVPSHMLKQK